MQMRSVQIQFFQWTGKVTQTFEAADTNMNLEKTQASSSQGKNRVDLYPLFLPVMIFFFLSPSAKLD